MAISPLTRYRIRIVLSITLAWVVLGVFIETSNSLSFDPVSERYFLHFPFGKNFLEHLLITAVGPLLGGLTGGSLIVFVLRERLRRRSFLYKLIVQSVVFLALIILLIMVVSSIQALLGPDDFWRSFVDDVLTWRVFRLLITWFFVVICTLMVLDVSDKYGKGILGKIITGAYHRPRVEERVFMFMDLKDSTKLAEQLGETKYFKLLRAVFFLTTNPILNSEGEIYQYVGDEIVLSWPVHAGLARSNCVRCYFNIIHVIDKHRGDFEQEFGVVPEFKAAIHMGPAVMGEIGVIKKDIVYAGDVLNSTSRILNLAKSYGRDLLVSDSIREKLQSDTSLQFSFCDEIVLRGRSVGTRIYACRQV